MLRGKSFVRMNDCFPPKGAAGLGGGLCRAPRRGAGVQGWKIERYLPAFLAAASIHAPIFARPLSFTQS